MTSPKRAGRYRRLEVAVAQVQRRWGPRALRLVSQTTPPPSALPTGFVSLDAVTGIGGFPRGRISELLGPSTSGKTSLALIALAHAQRCGGIGAYFDLVRALDPDYARRCGIDLHRLLIVHPPNMAEALAIAASLARRRGLQLIVFDTNPASWPVADAGPVRGLAPGLRLLSATLASTPCVALFLTTNDSAQPDYPGQLPLPAYATLRLSVVHERWIQWPWEDVTGYVAVVAVIKNKLGAPGRRATITITFNDAVRGHGQAGDGGQR